MNTEKKYSVYGHVNIANGKWYVGMTSTDPKERWDSGWGYQNQPRMWSDIKETDWNNDWIHTVFDTFNNREDALDYEAFLIGMFDTIENGYNTSEYGGFSCKHTEETKKKITESHGVYGILQFSKNGEFIAEYPSGKEAQRKTGCANSSICRCCKGERKFAGGYIWRYK